MSGDSGRRASWLELGASRSIPGAPAKTALSLLDMRPPNPELYVPMTRRRVRVRLGRASWAFSTRRVPTSAACIVLPLEGRPRVGDVVLARVDAIGHHGFLHLPNGRRRQLFPGSEVVVAYGHRYAPNQFEAEVPDSLGPCHLVAGGGVAARARSWHVKVSRGPTEITPVGLLASANGKRINLLDY